VPRELACVAGVALAECFLLRRRFPPEPALPSPSLAPRLGGLFFEGPCPEFRGLYSKTVSRAPVLSLAVIVLADGAAGGDELTGAQSVLLRLVRTHKLVGDHAATVVRDAGRPEVYFAFEDESAAREFAAVVKAKRSWQLPGLGESAGL
jgi:hypothetical protein